MEEIWRIIKNPKLNNKYEISNTGKIRNINTKKELSIHINKSKGCVCSYSINGKSSNLSIKNEVYRAFIDNNYNGVKNIIVNIDGDIFNNKVDNLKLIERNNKEYYIKEIKKNQYIIENDYVKVFINSLEYFLIDKIDIDLLEYTWYKRNNGYICSSNYNGTNAYIHKIIAYKKYNQNKVIIDHINRNKMDNRRCNLRIATLQQNNQNQNISKNNKSGIIGVSKYYETKKGIKWRAYIKVNGKTIQLLQSYNFQDCVVARLRAEKEYFGEFAPQRELFEKYGI